MERATGTVVQVLVQGEENRPASSLPLHQRAHRHGWIERGTIDQPTVPFIFLILRSLRLLWLRTSLTRTVKNNVSSSEHISRTGILQNISLKAN